MLELIVLLSLFQFDDTVLLQPDRIPNCNLAQTRLNVACDDNYDTAWWGLFSNLPNLCQGPVRDFTGPQQMVCCDCVFGGGVCVACWGAVPVPASPTGER